MEKYGTRHTGASADVIAKRNATMMGKYGVKNAFQSDVIKEKMKETSLKRYGVEYPSSSSEVRGKVAHTMSMKTDEERESEKKKRRETNEKKYLSQFTTEQMAVIEDFERVFNEDHVEGMNTLGYVSKKHGIPLNFFRSLMKKHGLNTVKRFYTSQGEKDIADFVRGCGLEVVTKHSIVTGKQIGRAHV